MPRTGIAILISLVMVVTYGAIAKGNSFTEETDALIADAAGDTKAKAEFAIIF